MLITKNTAFLSNKCKPLNNLFVHVINLKLFLGWLLRVAVFSPAVRRENNQYLLEIKLRMCLAHYLLGGGIKGD